MTVSSASPTLSDVTTADFSAFRTAASEAFVPLTLKTDDPDHFVGRIRGVDLDDVHVSEINATPHTVERTSELIARGDRAYVKVSLQLAGSGLLVQDGREAVLRPGDIALYDTNRPYSLLFEDDMRMMVIMFPRTQLELPPESVSQLTAVRFAHDATVTQIVAPFLERMTLGLERINGAIGLRLARNAIDLVSTMLADELGTNVDTDHRSLLLARIRSYVEEQLGDPHLDPAKIAAAHFISTRHLHGLFHEQGTTVSAWVRSRRLERCRRELTDPVHAGRPIGAIAARWGFLDAAHFSRLFKSTYALSPRELRTRVLGETMPVPVPVPVPVPSSGLPG